MLDAHVDQIAPDTLARLMAPPPLQRATIYIEDGGWMLDHADDPCAADVRLLFATTVLPMPFLAAAPERMVRDCLTRKNPGVVITRGDDK